MTSVYAVHKPSSGIVNIFESIGKRIGGIYVPTDVDSVTASGTTVYVNRGNTTTMYKCSSGTPKESTRSPADNRQIVRAKPLRKQVPLPTP